MASDDLLFSSYAQANFNCGGGGTTSVYKPGFCTQEERVVEFKLWSPNGHSDLLELSNCALNSIRSRKNTEKNENMEEVELQCLVSNILDEDDDIQSGFYNRKTPSIANSLWHPKTLREDLLQYFQPQDTVPNYVPNEALIQSQVVSKNEQFLQGFSGIPANLHSHISVLNGDRDSYGSHSKPLSPGLPISKMANQFPPQTLESNYDLSADFHQAYHQPINNIPQISDVFQLQNKMSRPFFDHHESVMSASPISNNEQGMLEHMDQLASGLKSLMDDASNQGRYGCFPTIERKTEYPEDSIPEQWKFPSQPMQMFCKKTLEGEFWGQNVKPAFEHQGVQEMSVLGNENAEYFPQIKSISMSSNSPNQYQNIIKRNQYFNPCSKQQGQYKMKSLMQKQKKKMPGCIEERLQTTACVAKTHRRPYVDHLSGMETFNRENIMGNVQLFIPLAHVDSKARSFTQLPVMSEKDTTPHGNGSPAVTPTAEMALNGAAALYSHFQGSEAHNGERTCEEGDSLAASLEMNPGRLVIQFYLHLDECSEQLGYLEGERKKTEVTLAQIFPGEWTPPPPPRCPPGLSLNATKLNCLILYQKRELANVQWLLYKMEHACNVPLHANIHLALNNHHQALSCVQARRGEELANASKHPRHGAPLTEDHDTLLLIIALKELTVTTKNLCRGLWCALQMTMPTPTRSAEGRPETDRELLTALWCSLRMAAPTPVRKPDDQTDTNREETRAQICPYSVML
ncbi:uncharacterized protein moto [Vanacampus margaritifer]